MTIHSNDLPESVQSLPLDYLYIDVKARNALLHHIDTIGKLPDFIAKGGLADIRRRGVATTSQIEDVIGELLTFVGEDQRIDWDAYWESRKEHRPPGLLQILEDVRNTRKQVLSQEHVRALDINYPREPTGIVLGECFDVIESKGLTQVWIRRDDLKGKFRINSKGLTRELIRHDDPERKYHFVLDKEARDITKYIEEILGALINSFNEENQVDRNKYAESRGWYWEPNGEPYWEWRGVKLFPELRMAREQILEELPAIMREILSNNDDAKVKRQWRTIQSRYQIEGANFLTLKELGSEFGVSREWVRQIEQNALDTLSGVLVEGQRYWGKNNEFAVRKEVVAAVQSLLPGLPSTDPLEPIEKLLDRLSEPDSNQTDDSVTEVEKSQRIRRGQDVFRSRVLENFDYKCCLSEVSEPELLKAAHIIPWADQKDTRLDRRNGLCLIGTYHDLFDQGYISFTDDLQVLITPRYSELSKPLQVILDSLRGAKARKPLRQVKIEYLQYHRNKWRYCVTGRLIWIGKVRIVWSAYHPNNPAQDRQIAQSLQ